MVAAMGCLADWEQAVFEALGMDIYEDEPDHGPSDFLMTSDDPLRPHYNMFNAFFNGVPPEEFARRYRACDGAFYVA